MGKFIDMTGWVMKDHGVPDSRLTVIQRDEDHIQPNGHHKAQWLCKCSCEKQTVFVVLGESIRRGHTLSCGCVQQERSSDVMKEVVAATRKDTAFNRREYCRYEIDGEKVTGWTNNNNEPFYFNLEFFDKVKDICWNDVNVNGLKRLTGRDRKSGKMVFFHQYIGYKNYDHADRNELNNLLNNLRPATRTQNAQNKSRQKNNTSGVSGVGWNKSKQKWVAYIRDHGKQLCLGSFVDKEDAIRARLLAEKEIFKEFAPQQDLYEKYNIC